MFVVPHRRPIAPPFHPPAFLSVMHDNADFGFGTIGTFLHLPENSSKPALDIQCNYSNNPIMKYRPAFFNYLSGKETFAKWEGRQVNLRQDPAFGAPDGVETRGGFQGVGVQIGGSREEGLHLHQSFQEFKRFK